VKAIPKDQRGESQKTFSKPIPTDRPPQRETGCEKAKSFEKRFQGHETWRVAIKPWGESSNLRRKNCTFEGQGGGKKRWGPGTKSHGGLWACNKTQDNRAGLASRICALRVRQHLGKGTKKGEKKRRQQPRGSFGALVRFRAGEADGSNPRRRSTQIWGRDPAEPLSLLWGVGCWV